MATPRRPSKPSRARAVTKATAKIARRGKSMAEAVSEDVKYRINLATRKAMVDIMNDLAERGPAYSGAFRDSWIAIPVGSGASGSAGGEYPYQLSNVPQLSTKGKEAKRVVVFEIVNTAPYAEIALDLKEGKFVKPEYEPLGGVEFGVAIGKRFGRTRGQVADGANGGNISTANLDWYTTYARSEIDPVIRRAFRFAFKPGARPKAQ